MCRWNFDLPCHQFTLLAAEECVSSTLDQFAEAEGTALVGRSGLMESLLDFSEYTMLGHMMIIECEYH